MSEGEGTDGAPREGRGRVLVAALIAAVLLAGGGYLAGRLTAPTLAAPSTDSAAAGFLRDMQVHHAQAVEMAFIIRDRTDDPGIRQLAYDITYSQSHQAGHMYGLLEAWDLPQLPPGPPMAWTLLPTIDGSAGGHDHDPVTGEMPGIVSAGDLARLSAASGVEAERIFLELMIAHHEGGVAMADAALARTTVPQVVSLARAMARAQRAEIDLMRDLLAERRGR